MRPPLQPSTPASLFAANLLQELNLLCTGLCQSADSSERSPRLCCLKLARHCCDTSFVKPSSADLLVLISAAARPSFSNASYRLVLTFF